MYSFCMNPCPCGWYSDASHECTCNPAVVTRYQKRISGPLLDPLGVDTLRASRSTKYSADTRSGHAAVGV